MADSIDNGWLSWARVAASPNCNERPDPQDISLLVIHNISLPPKQFQGDAVERFFCNQLDWSAHPYFETIRGMQVSAHLFIRRDGEVIQFVPLHRRAWHAGQSQFAGRSNCNDFSIGIELEGDDHIPYTESQYAELGRITRALLQAFPALTPERIVGHNDIAPQRKTDPGPAFDWSHYRALLAQPANTTD